MARASSKQPQLSVRKNIDTTGFRDGSYKVARICWNTEYWQKPTGKKGKVSDSDAFEAKYGYGHEEWLFDLTAVVDGWKYGFIQALNKSRNYAGEVINLLFYTIDNKSRSRYWVAAAKNVEVLLPEESADALKRLEKRNVLKEMRRQVTDLDLDASQLSDADPTQIINLRYRPEDLAVFEPIQFPVGRLGADYYGILQDVPDDQRGVLQGQDAAAEVTERNINTLTSKRVAYASSTEVDLKQKQWQKELKKTLAIALPEAHVYVEADVHGHSVDIYVEQGGKRFFIELKTQSVVRRAIREALAQLMEYSFWPPKQPRADVLVIVAPGVAQPAEQEYLAFLRKKFGIPIYYLQYSERSIVGISDFVSSFLKK